ncbi:Transcription factor like [Melia azedarach]|uniref:Transcription factor like n=1 Tax=Melia azedarach TaxID=155640 RepID=A0ACC1YZW1_MELAZ|nr:Transcription factor like [Melia azedarach]
MENSLNPAPTSTIPTFLKKPESNTGHSLRDHETFRCNKTPQKILTQRKRTRDIRAVQKQQQRKEKEEVEVVSSSGDEKEEEEDEKAELERKIAALQRIVPGGESLGVDKLFEETAGYILALQCQIKAMKALANYIEGLEKEKRKFGG